MPKKPAREPEAVVSKEILEQAKRSLETDRIKKIVKCSVCGAEGAPISDEPLCWVCRRLKISAWKDSDLQASVQE